MMLSLPIPMNEIENSVYYFIFYDHSICPLKSKYYLKKSSSVIELREQIAEQLNIDPWSFILSQIDDNVLTKMYCRNRSIADISEEDGILFAFQIDPSVFESQKDIEVYKKLSKLTDSSENLVNMSTISDEDDFNNSISREWVKVPLSLTMMEITNNSFHELKTSKSFTRILWLNRNWDLITVHKKVLNFLRFFFDLELENFYKLSEEEAFLTIFDDLTEENWKDKCGDGDEPDDYCYSLNI